MPSVPLEADDPPEIGAFRLLGRLGEGGQGVVYLGQAPDGQRVAVKVLKTTSPAALARFSREMEAAKRVAPFCTAAVLESSATGRHPYVVSEYVDGPSLQQRVREHGPLRGGELDRLMVNTASGLTAIHGAGIVHRDLKPANVLLGPDGPRVVDFGIARAVDAETHTQMVGTPAYFAPEWLRGEPPTPASDVFAWAGTMVHAATGRPPFGSGSNIPALMHRIATEQPDLSGVPEQLRSLLLECLDKDPSRRPTARTLLVRLADPSASQDHSAPSPPGGRGPSGSSTPWATHGAPGPQPEWGAASQTVPPRDAAVNTQRPQNTRDGRKGLGRTLALVGGTVVMTAALVLAAVFLLRGDEEPGDNGGNGSTQAATTPPASNPAGSTSAPSGGEGVPAALGGTWTGEVTQPVALGTPTSDVTIKLTGGQKEGTADYPTWGCYNKLTLTRSNGSTLEFSEAVVRDESGLGGCQGGTVKLTLQDGRLAYESPTVLGGTTTGTLSKG